MEFFGMGGYHGLIRLVEGDVKSLLIRGYHADCSNKVINIFASILKWIITFTIVMTGWILFRVNDISDFFYVIGRSFEGISNPFVYLKDGLIQIGLVGRTLYELIASISLFLIGEVVLENKGIALKYFHFNRKIRWIIYVLMFLFIILMMPVSGNKNFIYFQF